MKSFVLAFLLVEGCTAASQSATPDLAEIAKAMMDESWAADPDHAFVRVEVFPVPGEKDLYVAIEDTWAHGFGTFACFKYERGRFLWFAGVSDAPGEQSILEVRGVRLPGFPHPFVEVFGTTHMGNGDCYLYALEAENLRLVLKTRAVDNHQDQNLIRGPHLTVDYRDLNGDGYADVEFTGIVEEYSEDARIETPLRWTPCRKVFLWDPKADRFVEDKSKRRGFETYAEEHG
jgi:hypothetical protein